MILNDYLPNYIFLWIYQLKNLIYVNMEITSKKFFK